VRDAANHLSRNPQHAEPVIGVLVLLSATDHLHFECAFGALQRPGITNLPVPGS
jgi:hypothetical protein